MKTLSVAIVGLGRLGKRHALNLQFRIANAQIVAACSPLPDELDWARENLGEVSCYADYQDVLNDPAVQAVVLVTPTTLHAEQIIAALQAGKHVFCEKPLALNISDCERVEAVAAQNPQLKVMIGFVRRFDPSYYSAWQTLQAQSMGEPFFVRSQTCDQLDPSGSFVKFAATSGGLFMDCSVHDIDLARWLLGNPNPIRAYASGVCSHYQELKAFNDIDNGVATVEFDNGKMAVFYASRTFAHGHETRTEVIAQNGNLTIGDGAQKNRVVMSKSEGIFHQTTPDFFARFSEAFLLELEHFVDAVLHDSVLRLNLSDATAATQIGLKITQALHSGEIQTF